MDQPLTQKGKVYDVSWVHVPGGDSHAQKAKQKPARKNQSDLMTFRNKRLCSTCQEIKMMQPTTVIVPDYLKLSLENFVSQRMMSLHQRRARTAPKPSREDLAAESVRYRLPILGPRTAVFYGLLSDAYKVLQENQRPFAPRKDPWGKTGAQ